MAKVKNDVHTKFVLRGGPHKGSKIRLYPENAAEVRQGKAPLFEPLVWGDHTYEQPARADQSDKKPYLIYKKPHLALVKEN